MIEITPVLNEKLNKPIYIQLYEYIKLHIEDGNIPAYSRLPSIRKLSHHLNTSRNTVESAYGQLLAEGYIESKPRSGLFVNELKENFLIKEKEGVDYDISQLFASSNSPYKINFWHGNIDTDLFPTKIWKRLTNQTLQNDTVLLYGDRQGEPELRLKIAEYLYQSRGVKCSPDQIIIGAGIQQLLSLCCLLIGMEKNQKAAIENPGYTSARNIFRQYGFNIEAVPLTNNGICLETLMSSGARLVFVTPSHQFPMGMIMPIANRIKLLQWAEKENVYIIEDDYDSEFRYNGKPIPALKGLDSAEKVIYFGTFSKALSPSIRISYMVLPRKLMKEYNKDFGIYQQPTSKIHQITLYNFMKEGYWSTHLRRIRTKYQKKQESLIRAVKKYMQNNVKIIGTGAGVHILLEIQKEITEQTLIQQAKDIHIGVYPTSKYWIGENKNKYPIIQLGFGGLSLNDIDLGIYLLSRVWFLKH